MREYYGGIGGILPARMVSVDMEAARGHCGKVLQPAWDILFADYPQPVEALGLTFGTAMRNAYRTVVSHHSHNGLKLADASSGRRLTLNIDPPPVLGHRGWGRPHWRRKAGTNPCRWRCGT